MKKIIDESLVKLDIAAKTSEEVIAQLACVLDDSGRLNDKTKYVSTVKAREDLCPTSMGFDVAIPHGKCDSVKTASVAFARLKEAIRWGEEEVKYVFLLAVPEAEAGNKHLEILAQLARKLMHDEFKEQLQQLRCEADLVNLVALEN